MSTCRGIRLDRGELEGLVGRATAEIEAESEGDARRRPDRQAASMRRETAEVANRRYFRGDHDAWGLRRQHDRDDDDDDRDARGRYRHPRKKRWFELLGDVFD